MMDWTPRDRANARYCYEIRAWEDDPPYVEPVLPELHTVLVASGKGNRVEPEYGTALWQWLDSREGNYASQLNEGSGTGVTYYFDDPNIAFEFKMMFG